MLIDNIISKRYKANNRKTKVGPHYHKHSRKVHNMAPTSVDYIAATSHAQIYCVRSRFLGAFWHEHFTLQGSKFCMSPSHHPGAKSKL